MRLKRIFLQTGLAAALVIPLLDLWIWILATLLPGAGRPEPVALIAAAATAAWLVAALWRAARQLRRKHGRR